MNKMKTVKDAIASYDSTKCRKVPGLYVSILTRGGSRPQLVVNCGGLSPELFSISKAVANALIASGVNHGS
jgi:hypothetical protein